MEVRIINSRLHEVCGQRSSLSGPAADTSAVNRDTFSVQQPPCEPSDSSTWTWVSTQATRKAEPRTLPIKR